MEIACQASLSFTIFQSLHKFMSICPRVCSNSLSQWSYPTISSFATLFSICLQSFPASRSFPVRQFLASGGQKFSFSISHSSENLELISFRIDWLQSVQGTLKSFLQHHNSKTSVLQSSVFFMAQLSYLYMTTGKIIALTIWTFAGRVMPLLFNTLSRFVIACSSEEHLLISWQQSSSAEILESKEIKSVTASTFSPSICHEVMGPDTTILVFWMLSLKPAFSLCSFQPHQEAL